jgi:hypothetical protein
MVKNRRPETLRPLPESSEWLRDFPAVIRGFFFFCAMKAVRRARTPRDCWAMLFEPFRQAMFIAWKALQPLD